MNTLSTHTNIPVDIKYARPQLENAADLQAFFFQTLADNFFYFPAEAHHHYKKAWQLSQLNTRISAANDLLICAWNQNEIVGLVSGPPPEGGVGTIIWLSVSPNYQNLGIGTELVSLAKEYFKSKGAHKLKLTVHDPKALKFYQREGFIIEALHKNHWWNLDFWAIATYQT